MVREQMVASNAHDFNGKRMSKMLETGAVTSYASKVAVRFTKVSNVRGAPFDSSTLYIRPSTAHSNRFVFTGREWMGEIGLYDYRKRVYSPELGRFLQTDPIRLDAGDVNLYRYVSNSPINTRDVLGLTDSCCLSKQWQGEISFRAIGLFYVRGSFNGSVVCTSDESIVAMISGSVNGFGLQAGYITGSAKVSYESKLKNELKGQRGGIFIASLGIGIGPINILGVEGSVSAAHIASSNNADFTGGKGTINGPGVSTDFNPVENPAGLLEKPKAGLGFSLGFLGIEVINIE